MLVALVVFVFLQGWRATLIPLLAVPVSLIGTFASSRSSASPINTLSLFGLVLAIGLVVDDAIVVVEAVEHHIEEGLSPRDATVKAMSEVAGPVLAIAIILAAVFVPTAFIPGITGRLYQQFALTIAISVHLGLQRPVAEPRPLRAPAQAADEKPGPLGGFYRWFNAWFGKARGYVGLSRGLIRKSAISMLILGASRRRPTSFEPAAQGVPARRGPGLLLRRAPAPERGLAPADLGRGPPGGGRSSRRPRGPDLHVGHRVQPPQHRLQHLQLASSSSP